MDLNSDLSWSFWDLALWLVAVACLLGVLFVLAWGLKAARAEVYDLTERVYRLEKFTRDLEVIEVPAVKEASR